MLEEDGHDVPSSSLPSSDKKKDATGVLRTVVVVVVVVVVVHRILCQASKVFLPRRKKTRDLGF